jgi:hypothetical protein
MNATELAVQNGHTTYRKSVKIPNENVLKPGSNNKKLGYKITKGRWKGKYLYSLTLEERATCPRYCHHWDDCYGNNMPFAHRYSNNSSLLFHLHATITRLCNKHPGGVVIRLHVLGDFYSVDYVKFWEQMLIEHPTLNIFGYTARWGDDIQYAIHIQLNRRFPDRCVIRYSRNQEYDETTKARFAAEEGFTGPAFTCPEQTGKAASCAECGLCWASGATKTVKFLSH